MKNILKISAVICLFTLSVAAQTPVDSTANPALGATVTVPPADTYTTPSEDPSTTSFTVDPASTYTDVPATITNDTYTPTALSADSTSKAANETIAPPPTEPVLASAAVAKPTGSTANNLKKANLLYNEKAFAEAIPFYEKARIMDPGNKMILSNLGDCYRLTNNAPGQLHCYGELVRSASAEPKHELYYAQALVTMGEAEKAQPFFEKYTADNRGKELALSLSRAKAYTRNMDAYVVIIAPFNSLQNDICAVKYQDQLVFASTREKNSWIKKQQGWTNGDYLKLYTTEMDGSTIPAPFMGDLDSKYNDGPITFSKDYNTVYFTRNSSKKEELAKDNTYKLKILEASLDANGFSMVKVLPFNNKDYNFAHPSLSPDGYTLYFASDMEGGKGGMDIYVSKKDSAGTWGTPYNLGENINTAGNETFPFIANGGLLYFSSDGHDGLGGLDIYEARMKDNAPTKIYNMGEPVNSRNDDFGLFLFEDNKTGYLSSNRKVGGLDDDIYSLQILREVKRGKDVTIITKDKSTEEILPNTKVVINADTIETNEKGEYLANVEEDINYKLVALKNSYFNAEDSINTKSSTEDSFIKELVLEKDPQLFLRGLVTDARTNELLEGASIKLVDITTNADLDTYTTTASGDYFKFLYGTKIGDRLTYLIKIEKPGYLPRSMIFTHTIDKPGEINLNESLNLSLGKVEVGMDLAKMIDLKPIYFDMGKATIRQDAAMELDKIVQIMNEYPNMFIELGSHTDCRSSAASNLKLSTSRAKASAAYIVKKGINKLRITGKGYGETKILNNCLCEGSMQSSCPEEEHAKNRRTEFVITKLK